MADMDQDEEVDDTFVTIGTPLEPYDEDEEPKKPVLLQDQVARDRQGRVRFHGAFTGGFSAGYFNTVGSKEGFTPSTFVSSKNKRVEKSEKVAGPEAFMDEEDLDQFGINPLTVSTTSDVTSTRRPKRPATSSGSIIPGDLEALSQLVLPARLTIGVKLLRSLGWKDGQGVGPRVKRKVKRKVYGCILPGQHNEGSSEDEYTDGMTFAPKDVSPIDFTPKVDTKGIGYRGINPHHYSAGGSTSGHVELFNKPAITKTGRKGITGQAFGVGALEDDDDDIYGTSNMAGYDRELFDESDHLHGWTAPGAAGRRNKQSRFSDNEAVSYVGRVLEGFKLTSVPQQPKPVYGAPSIPRDYRPIHIFTHDDLTAITTQTPLPQRSKMDANTRSTMLGDIGSVFDLVSRSDKDKIAAAKTGVRPEQTTTASTVTTAVSIATVTTTTAPLISDSTVHRPDIAAAVAAVSTPTFTSTSSTANFKPFAKDAHKQQRYEAYLDRNKPGHTGVLEQLRAGMTEWEREKEEAEFQRSEQLYKPMSLLMASRFERAQYSDDTKADDVKLKDRKQVLSDAEQAAAAKMFGRLTRESYEWHPNRVVCKRFNLRNPYPDSSIVGLRTAKQDKYSVFDFLTIPAAPVPPAPAPEQPSLADVAAVKNKNKRTGPLAILNKPSTELAIKPPIPDPSVTLRDEQIDEAAESLRVAEPVANVTETTDNIQDKNSDESEAQPLPDLFKAIFDSSSESDSDHSEEKDDKDGAASGDSEESEDAQQAQHLGTDRPDARQLGEKQQAERDFSRNVETPSLKPSEHPRSEQMSPSQRPRGVFDMINAQTVHKPTHTGSREDHLGNTPGPSDSSMSEFYGPRLPPTGVPLPAPGGHVTSRAPHRTHRSRSRDRDKDRSRDRKKDRSDDRSEDRKRNRSQSRDRKDRKRDRSKNRKRDRSSEKSKKKKSKDKKKKKKAKHKKQKNKKSKKQRRTVSDSDDADSESSTSNGSDSESGSDVPSSADILQRLMMLKKKPTTL